LLAAGKTITVNLDAEKGRLYFKCDDLKRDSFAVKMRRTNPGGSRDLFAHQAISFGATNSYAMDFGQWYGKGEMCFYEWCDVCDPKRCTKLGNEAVSRSPHRPTVQNAFRSSSAIASHNLAHLSRRNSSVPPLPPAKSDSTRRTSPHYS
jgi:hypothetical protein